MDKNTNQLPNGVKWPCYTDNTPVEFGDEIGNGIGHFPVKSFRFTQNGWAAYDAEIPASAHFAECGGYDDFVTRYVEPDSWQKWSSDLEELLDHDGDACVYFGRNGKTCEGCRAFGEPHCTKLAVKDLKRRAIELEECDR